MKQRNKRIFALVLVCVLALAGCGNASSPERTVEKFFSAVKAGDMEKSIECFTPVMQEQYKAVLSISDSIFGAFGAEIDSNTLLNGIIGTINADSYKNYDFKVVSSSQPDSTHATVTVDVYVDGNKTDSTTVSCVKIDDAWYIEN